MSTHARASEAAAEPHEDVHPAPAGDRDGGEEPEPVEEEPHAHVVLWHVADESGVAE